MRTVVKRKRPFTAEEYHCLLEAGILREDDRVERIEGEILEMSPIGSRHAAALKRLNPLFHDLLGAKCLLGVQDPNPLGPYSEPEPDLVLLKPRPDFYAEALSLGPGDQAAPLRFPEAKVPVAPLGGA